MKLPVVRKLHFKPINIISTIIIILLAIFFGRVALWEHSYLQRMEGSERKTITIYENDETVVENEPTATERAEYTVAKDKPRYFSIPSLGINNARVVEVGTKEDGSLDTPNNIYDVGWFIDSALPGNATGVSIIDAHGGALGDGIFKNLPSIQPGALINIEMGDGKLVSYKVVDLATKRLGTEANSYMESAAGASPEKGKGSLTLITCTGDWWLSSQTYSHRLFVRAVLQN